MPAPAPPPTWSALDHAVGTENYAEAKRLADGLLQRGAPKDRRKTMLVYGRILLSLGQREAARRYLAILSKAGGGGQLTAVYGAWLRALDGKPDEGINTLETMLKQASGAPDERIAEGADVLAMLHMARGENEEAKKAVDFGLKALRYRGVKSGYVLALLRGRLNSDFTAGVPRRLYNEAEKLREKGKFVEAGQLFARVRAKYPTNQWGHAAGFRIGQCYAGLDRPVEAIAWWQKFIKQSPTGPWRGQAHVAIVDLALESRVDVKKATEHAMAATAALSKGLDKGAEPSWKEAAYSIHLRQGIVSLVDGRFDAAAQAFQQAKETAPNGTSRGIQAGVSRLIETAQRRAKLIPDELNVGDDRAMVALSLGNVHHILRQYDQAKLFFALALTGPMRSHSAAHRSFARLGLARAVLASGQAVTSSKSSPQSSALDQAKAICEASLKEYPQGSWHDTTLREMALLTERAAIESSAPSAKKAAGEQGKKKPAAPESAWQQQKRALIAARFKALPFWNDLSERYPGSRHVPEALCHAGVLYADAGKPDKAITVFTELVKKHPASPWTGEAYVQLIDVTLERQFDLPGARGLAGAAIHWYEHLDQPMLARAGEDLTDDATSGLRSLKEAGYDIYIRAGLIEYLSQGDGTKRQPKQGHRVPRLAAPAGQSTSVAVVLFEKAKRLAPERNFVVVQGSIPTGVDRLAEVAKAGKSLTPQSVRQGNEKARLILMLADAYHAGEEWKRSLDLCNRIIAETVPGTTREQKSYAHFKRARNYYSLDGEDFNPEAALRDYVSAVRAAPRAEWASKAMFLAANILWNQYHNANAAVATWTRLAREYPDTIEADSGALFISVVYRWTNRRDDAKKVLNDFLARHPRSPVAQAAREQLRKLDAPPDDEGDSTQAQDNQKGPAGRRTGRPSKKVK